MTPVSSPDNRNVDHDDFNDYIDVDDSEYDDSDVIDDEYGDVNDDKTGIERVLKCNSCFFMMVSFIMAYSNSYICVWWEFDCVIFPPFIIMSDSHLVGI